MGLEDGRQQADSKPRTHSRKDSALRRDLSSAQETRLQVRRPCHRLRLDAGLRHRQRPQLQLLPPQNQNISEPLRQGQVNQRAHQTVGHKNGGLLFPSLLQLSQSPSTRAAHPSQPHREGWVIRATREPSSLDNPKIYFSRFHPKKPLSSPDSI